MRYTILWTRQALEHLRSLPARQRAVAVSAVERNLAHNVTVETRNRKRMRPNPLAEWEFRISDLRVYYDIEREPAPIVRIMAVGVKKRNQMIIGGEARQL